MVSCVEAVGSMEIREHCLADLNPGESARIADVNEPGALGERLLEMGLTPNTLIRVIRRGLFGKVLQIRVRNYMLSVRRDQALNIAVSR